MRNFLVMLLVLAMVLGAVDGANAFANARSAVHEIEGYICFLIVTIGAVGMLAAIGLGRIEEAVNRGAAVALNEAKIAEQRSLAAQVKQ